VNADPFAQLKLLDLQALDAEVDQLRHRLAHLPEEAEIAALATELKRVRDSARDQQIAVDDLTTKQKKADADVEQVKARRERDRQRMDQGVITNPKDLERMQHELETLERRITVLEDEELEVMEELEEAQKSLASLQASGEEIEGRLSGLVESRDAKRAELDAELARVGSQREPMIADVPDDLLALYEKLRANKGGIGAAELRAGQCGGCMLSLDKTELSRIKALPSDAVVRCEECQRILVRTAESGL
jgi:uncharacterized protein